MASARQPPLAAVLLLLSWGHHCLSGPARCPYPCTCQSDPVLLNCSSAGLYLVPQHIPNSVTELHLSHNHLPSIALEQPLPKLRALRLDNNSITHLSLCVDRTPGGRRGRRLRPWGRQACDSWAPTLQRLSVKWNQLQQLPEGESVLNYHSKKVTSNTPAHPAGNTVAKVDLLNIKYFFTPEYRCHA